jgi:hypothetical protein
MPQLNMLTNKTAAAKRSKRFDDLYAGVLIFFVLFILIYRRAVSLYEVFDSTGTLIQARDAFCHHVPM